MRKNINTIADFGFLPAGPFEMLAEVMRNGERRLVVRLRRDVSGQITARPLPAADDGDIPFSEILERCRREGATLTLDPDFFHQTALMRGLGQPTRTESA